ncbi:unnamed protein product [Vitrella brassicaformis CCMP3155]|uniref:Uncharacterized protein n=1 Tax=Vitrella brassicaformis (strain CCMP3155) TaxID=1169540 RepID=A0A0G4FFE9_VITBC|nr:unnamed protein product [Vitrella brassicaformis CCMP3155]|eukprot:CEM11886.1 unnamed protein product [Vitrella brassicaformis CCMP3155]
MQHTHHQQHPILYYFVGPRTFYVLSLADILRLRTTCTWLRDLFQAPELRQRLSHSLSTQAGLRRTATGQQLLSFDDRQMDVAELLTAVCVVELGGWGEMAEAIDLAMQLGYCQLPIILTAADLHQHKNKMVYMATPHVLAQLKMVGRHIHWGNGLTMRIFQRGGRLRAIKDYNRLELTLNPSLPAGHSYQQYRQPHDPPVRSRITHSGGAVPSHSAFTDSSMSSLVKRVLLSHFGRTHSNAAWNQAGVFIVDRHAGNNRLHILLMESPHVPVEGCSTTTAFCCGAGSDRRHRLVLTDASHSFVAWMDISDRTTGLRVGFFTTEAAEWGVGAAFKNRFPQTTRLARAVLGPDVAARMFGR